MSCILSAWSWGSQVNRLSQPGVIPALYAEVILELPGVLILKSRVLRNCRQEMDQVVGNAIT